MSTGAANPASQVCDPLQLGELLASARVWAGLETLESASQRVCDVLGVRMDARRIGALESGECSVTFEDACALTYVYGVPGGVNHLFDALRPPIGATLKRAQWPAPVHKKKDQ